MIQRVPFGHPAIAGDVMRLQGLLRESLTALRFQAADEIAVLNLACGRADDTGALIEALAPAGVGFYLGLDIRNGTIAEAKRSGAGPWRMAASNFGRPMRHRSTA